MKIAYLNNGRPDAVEFIPEDVEAITLTANADGVYDPDDLKRAADVEAFIVSMEPVNEQVLAACPHLKIVQRTGVGYERLDLAAAARRGVPCCNTPGVNKEAVAEHAMTLLLALAKKLPQAEQHLRRMEWLDARKLTKGTFEIKGKTMGIIGLGNTGAALARRARAFEMRILYNDIRDIDAVVIEDVGAQFREKPDLLSEADVVCINTDLNAETRGMIDAAALARMKPGVLLICCARGGIVDEPALAEALASGHVAGAGIDVFETEPIDPDNPLLSAPNIILTAHVAGVTLESTRRNYAWAHDNVRRVVERGESPQWVLNGV